MPVSPVVREVNGRLEVEWPEGHPPEGWFAMTPELFIELVGQINDLSQQVTSLGLQMGVMT